VNGGRFKGYILCGRSSENNSKQPDNTKQQANGSLRKRVNFLSLSKGSCEGGVEVAEKMMTHILLTFLFCDWGRR
jgi:hypothetical protein